eukprot:TRINITY_DN5590_c0_g1_i2.p1 TRINITY_DN5590_c0_g1~~TRINITY_DN5590_c0_g1_i2.p1  ORF type:complete len:519 (+),score=132.00 TRINITY_DN5590_c0_g1_i2:88-1644(+)
MAGDGKSKDTKAAAKKGGDAAKKSGAQNGGSPLASEPSAKGAGSKAEQELEELRAKMAEAREEISLRSSPIKTFGLFVRYVTNFCIRKTGAVLRSPILWLLVVPGVALWIALKQSLAPELFTRPVCGESDGGVLWQVELFATEAAWWIILGILSSVGFGTGLHSGLMFLFPHVMQVVAAAEACHTTTGLVAWYQHPCKLMCSTTSGPKDDSTVTFFRLWMLVTVQCMLWGVGTAVGELPPYAVSKAARLAGKKDDEFTKEIEEARSNPGFFNKMKIWTIDFTEKHGFVGVFLLAAWPNAAFDMCGMACGYLLMPFWTFFIATALGKGVAKVNLQAAFFVNLFGSGFFHMLLTLLDSLNATIHGFSGRDFGIRQLAEKGRTKLVNTFELQSRFSPEKLMPADTPHGLDLGAIRKLYAKSEDSHAIGERVLASLDADGSGRVELSELRAAAWRDGKVSLGSLDPGSGDINIAKTAWELFIVCLVVFFLLSIVVQLARLQQAEYDEAELEKKQGKSNKKKD